MDQRKYDSKNIQQFLSHHYVLQRSIIFIVDIDYSSIFYKEKASQYVASFFDSMQPTELFGYINLSNRGEEMQLEPKARNTLTKQRFLRGMNSKSSEMLLGDKKHDYQLDRLQDALQKALDWQQ